MSRKWNHLLEAYTGHHKTRQISKTIKDSLKELGEVEKEVIEMSKKISKLIDRLDNVNTEITTARHAMSDGGIPNVELEEIRKANAHAESAQAVLDDVYEKISDVESAVKESQSELSEAEDVFIELAKSGTFDPTA